MSSSSRGSTEVAQCNDFGEAAYDMAPTLLQKVMQICLLCQPEWGADGICWRPAWGRATMAPAFGSGFNEQEAR